jgi:hypothetical protein
MWNEAYGQEEDGDVNGNGNGDGDQQSSSSDKGLSIQLVGRTIAPNTTQSMTVVGIGDESQIVTGRINYEDGPFVKLFSGISDEDGEYTTAWKQDLESIAGTYHIIVSVSDSDTSADSKLAFASYSIAGARPGDADVKLKVTMPPPGASESNALPVGTLMEKLQTLEQTIASHNDLHSFDAAEENIKNATEQIQDIEDEMGGIQERVGESITVVQTTINGQSNTKSNSDEKNESSPSTSTNTNSSPSSNAERSESDGEGVHASALPRPAQNNTRTQSNAVTTEEDEPNPKPPGYPVRFDNNSTNTSITTNNPENDKIPGPLVSDNTNTTTTIEPGEGTSTGKIASLPPNTTVPKEDEQDPYNTQNPTVSQETTEGKQLVAKVQKNLTNTSGFWGENDGSGSHPFQP